MKTIKTIREATSAGDIAQLDRQIQPIFDRLMNAADTLEKELLQSFKKLRKKMLMLTLKKMVMKMLKMK